MTDLLKKGMEYVWGPEQQRAFTTILAQMAANPILRQPEPEKPFLLHTDWSQAGLGAVLAQKDDKGQEYVVAYASRSNNPAESRYSSYEGECLAAVWAIAYFRPYLYGRPFKLITDHQPLK